MNIKNISILAHVDAGKTSLTEAFLNTSGTKHNFGSVDEGTTYTDTDSLEIEKGISIYTSTTSTVYKNTKINIIDTPGHMDFINEVEQALIATDLAILVIAANDNKLKSQTYDVYHKLIELNIPTLIFINKIDLDNADVDNIITQVQMMTRHKSFVLDDYNSCLEYLALTDDRLLNQFLDGTVDEEYYENILIKCINNLECFPILKGSAKNRIGITDLLDLVVLLSCEMPREEELSAIIYKKQYTPDSKLQTYIRIYSGTLNHLDTLMIDNQEVKLTNLNFIDEGTLTKIESVESGDIAVITDSLDYPIGTWIGKENPHKVMSKWTEGHYSVKVIYESGSRVEVLGALNKIIVVSPFVTYSIEDVSQDIIIHLVGEVQRDVILHTLRNDYGLNVELGEITVSNKLTPKESITDTVIMDTIENSHWATMTFEMTPLPLGSGIEYETLVNTGYLRQAFQNAILESLDRVFHCPFNNHYLTDFKIVLTFAEFASPVSTPSDFRHSTKILFNKIMNQVSFTTLEPMGLFKLSVPESSVKKAYADLTVLEANITDTTIENDNYVITGEMLLRNAINYESKVINFTQGEGSFTIEPSCYKPK